MADLQLTTYQKASQINRDDAVYGSFAEIGAGQETARWFFQVGRAARTVAKTISAYDMTVSDTIYGVAGHYVSRGRLQSMLDYEYELLLQRLVGALGRTKTFFVLADTCAMRSHARLGGGHAWMGIRFQHQVNAPPSDIILHIQMQDKDHAREQEALGVLGVNLIYGAFYRRSDPAALIASLMDGLTRDRIEIDTIKFSGSGFAGVDNRLVSLQLVEQGFTDATMFTADGEVVQPAEVLFEKPVLVERGSFRPITNATLDMLERSQKRFAAQLGGASGPGGPGDLGVPGETSGPAASGRPGEPVVVMEMSLRNLVQGDFIDHLDFLARVDILAAFGKTVMISNFGHHYRLAPYLRAYTQRPIVFAMGAPGLREMFEEKYYEDLGGGLLEAVGHLFQRGLKLYVYPFRDPESGTLVTAADVPVAEHLHSLYRFLLQTSRIEPITDVDERHLNVLPADVLHMIQSGNPAWQELVPPAAVELIKKHRCFGYCAAS